MRPRLRRLVAAALMLGILLPPGIGTAAPRGPGWLHRAPSPGRVTAGATTVSRGQKSAGQNTVQVLLRLREEPVARLYARSISMDRPMLPAELKNYRAKLQATQDQVVSQVAAEGGREIFRFQNALNSVLVKVPVSALPRLAQLPDVAGVYLARPVHLDNETSVPFIGADKVWEMVDRSGVKVTGKGIRVAVIDTGIDYYHAALGGSGDPEAYEQDDHTIVEPGTFPTAKVVGGYDLAGDDYDASNPQRDVPRPDLDPIDVNGHGTHVAATIGGVGVEGKIGQGVAPDVLLYAYKVFGREGSTNLTDAAIEMAMDPNGDGDLSDHVDVINMSLGSPFGEEIEAEVTQNAADLGIVVVASAGNNGDVPYITGSPAVAPAAISVAAAVDNGIVHGAIQVNSPASVAGKYEAVEAAITPPLAEVGDVTGVLVDTGGLGCSPSDFKANPAGQIALIDRGTCNFSVKIKNAQEMGARAVVVVNNNDGDPITMGGDSTGIQIPAVMIRKADGEKLRGAMEQEPVEVTLSARFEFPRTDLTNTLADFTSRGPGGARSGFKPDLAAPGLDIRSAAMGTGTEGVLMSGTSMAAPHVTGAAALLKQLHPDWTVAEIKAALQNTTTPAMGRNGNPYPLTLQGTGRIQVDKAAKATVLALPGGISFGHVPVSATTSVTRTVTLRNKSDTVRTFDLTVDFDGDSRGVQAKLSQDHVTVPAGGETTVDLTLTFDPSTLPSQWDEPFVEVGGWIRLQEQGGPGEDLVVGFTAFPEAVAQVEGTAAPDTGNLRVELKNISSTPGLALPFYLVNTDGPDNGMKGYEPADARYVGVRASQAYDPETGNSIDVLQFAVVTSAPWGADETVRKEIRLDSDGDGTPDYRIFTDNLRNYGYPNWPATFVEEIKSQALSVYYLTPEPTWYNANATVMTVPMDAVGLQPGQRFRFSALTYPISEAAYDLLPLTQVDEALTRTPLADLAVESGGSATLSWADPSPGLLLIYPDNGPGSQHQVFTVTDTAPAPPTDLKAVNMDRAVRLTWSRSSSPNTADYLVYRVGPDAKEPTLVAVVPQGESSQLSFTDTGLTNEKTYEYQVYARNRDGVRSTEAATVSAHPSAPPAQPEKFTGEAKRTGITLKWKKNTERDLAGYILYRMDPTSGWTEVARLNAKANSFTDTTANPSVTNTYGLVAVDQWGVESTMATTTVKRYAPPPSGGGDEGGRDGYHSHGPFDPHGAADRTDRQGGGPG